MMGELNLRRKINLVRTRSQENSSGIIQTEVHQLVKIKNESSTIYYLIN